MHVLLRLLAWRRASILGHVQTGRASAKVAVGIAIGSGRGHHGRRRRGGNGEGVLGDANGRGSVR